MKVEVFHVADCAQHVALWSMENLGSTWLQVYLTDFTYGGRLEARQDAWCLPITEQLVTGVERGFTQARFPPALCSVVKTHWLS